jgi:lysozyme
MDMERLKSDITRREGLSLHVYDDHLGNPTIGVGRLLSRGISKTTAMQMLEEDIDIVLKELQQNLPWFDAMPEAVQESLCDLGFNLGVPRLLKFKLTLGLLEAHQYKAAADELLNSRYATQVPNRAAEIAEQLRNA